VNNYREKPENLPVAPVCYQIRTDHLLRTGRVNLLTRM